jgi:hypothetical protein
MLSKAKIILWVICFCKILLSLLSTSAQKKSWRRGEDINAQDDNTGFYSIKIVNNLTVYRNISLKLVIQNLHCPFVIRT